MKDLPLYLKVVKKINVQHFLPFQYYKMLCKKDHHLFLLPSPSKDNIFRTILCFGLTIIKFCMCTVFQAFQEAQWRHNFMNMGTIFLTCNQSCCTTDFFLQFVLQCGLILLCDLTLFCLFVCPVLDAI